VQYQVKRMVRSRYGCRGCESTVMQAPAPAQPIDGGMATEAMLAHVVTNTAAANRTIELVPIHTPHGIKAFAREFRVLPEAFCVVQAERGA
jgi:hypothetical protein